MLLPVRKDRLDAFADAGVVDQIDEAQVGEEGHGELGDRLHDLPEVERPGEPVAEIREESKPVFELGQRRDVDDGRSIPGDAGARVAERDAHELRHEGAAPFDREPHLGGHPAIAEAAFVKMGSKGWVVLSPDEGAERQVDEPIPRHSQESRSCQVDVLNATVGIERAISHRRKVIKIGIPIARALDQRLRLPELAILHFELYLMGAKLPDEAGRFLLGDRVSETPRRRPAPVDLPDQLFLRHLLEPRHAPAPPPPGRRRPGKDLEAARRRLPKSGIRSARPPGVF